MDKTLKNYATLFISTFYLSAFTFGGGYVIIPLMKKKFVDQLAWMEEEEMLNLAAIAQSAPGPMAVNAAILVGSQLLGIGGAIVAILGTILPPLLILSVISIFYASFRENPVVAAVLKGMMAGVSAVIFDVVVSMARTIVHEKKIVPVILLVSVFIASFIVKINTIYIILFCGTLGALLFSRDSKNGKEGL